VAALPLGKELTRLIQLHLPGFSAKVAVGLL
jgi:hypothetical protein